MDSLNYYRSQAFGRDCQRSVLKNQFPKRVSPQIFEFLGPSSTMNVKFLTFLDEMWSTMLVGILRDQKSNYFHAKTQNDLDHEIATVPPYH